MLLTQILAILILVILPTACIIGILYCAFAEINKHDRYGTDFWGRK